MRSPISPHTMPPTTPSELWLYRDPHEPDHQALEEDVRVVVGQLQPPPVLRVLHLDKRSVVALDPELAYEQAPKAAERPKTRYVTGGEAILRFLGSLAAGKA